MALCTKGQQVFFQNIPILFFFLWRFDPMPGHGLPLQGFAITLRHTSFGRTPLDDWSVPRNNLYLKTHNIQKRQTTIFPAGFERKIPASERPQTHTLNSSATGIGRVFLYMYQNTRRHITENCDLVTCSLAISKKRIRVEWRCLRMKRWGEFLELKKEWCQLHNG